MALVYLSIGSNLGEKKENCQKAIEEISARSIGTVKDISPFYYTEPVDFTDQDWFVNAALSIETELSPERLLDALKKIQYDMGTVKKEVLYGPRIIDLDILFYDNLVFNGKELVIPHQRMHQRAFVLVPLCDIAGDMIHPVLCKTMKELLSALNQEHQGIKPLTQETHYD